MSEKSYTGLYFLLSVIAVYLIAGFFRPEIVVSSLQFSLKVMQNIAPVFVLVFTLMIVIDYFVSPKIISSYLGKSSGVKRWFIAITGGIISTGPIYMWYPMLRELKEQGVNYGFIAAFLYNRALKPPLIPVMLYYFGLKYVVVLTIVMIIMSIIQGVIIEKIEDGGFL